MKVIKLIAYEPTGEQLPDPSYLRHYDPEAHDGQGDMTYTSDPHLAMKFSSLHDAFACYQRQSKTRPTRNDGRPNKPLTAFTISVENVP